MAIVDEQASTQVTGSPVNRGKGAHPGEVLAERYEILEQLGRDPYVIDHRAVDQETDEPCIVRIVEPDLLVGTKAKVVARKVRGAVGIGGSFLPGIKDVDVDEVGRLFVVEPPPTGARLREVLGSRTSRGGVLEAREVLPVVARLASAIEAIPAPYHHGDVRLDRVWLAEDGLSLTFPFVMAMLPPTAIAGATQGHAVLSRCLAPELARGLIGGAADRFGVGCIVYELMTGELPTNLKGPFPQLAPLGEVGEIIGAFLSPSPKDRPPTLRPLVEAIAKSAGLEVPNLGVGAYRRPNRARGEVTSGLLLPPDEIVEPTPMGAGPRNRRALVTDTIEELAADLAESTSEVPTMSALDAAVALGGNADSEGYDDVAFTEKASPLSRGDTDGGSFGEPEAAAPAAPASPAPKSDAPPRGKLPAGAAAGGTQEIRAEDLEVVDSPEGDLADAPTGAGKHVRGALPVGAATGGTQEIRAEDLEVVDGPEDAAPGAGRPRGTKDPLRATISESSPPGKLAGPASKAAAARPEGTQQVRAEDILEVKKDPKSGKPSVKLGKAIPGAAREGTQQLRSEDIIDVRPVVHGVPEDTPVPAPAPSPLDTAPLLLSKAKQKPDKKRLPPAPQAPKGVVAVPPGRLPPAPQAKAPPASTPPASTPPAAEPNADRAPGPTSAPPAAAPPVARVESTPVVAPTGEYDADEPSSIDATAVAVHRPRSAAERRSRLGQLIVIGAVVLAVLIILGGVLIASRRRAEAEREHYLQQRFLELQQESATPD